MLVYGREYLRCSGLGCDGPSMLLTDNSANMSLATHAGAPGRAKHMLRRYCALLQSVRCGDIKIKHVPDATNPADFLTKWVGGLKLSRSIGFVTNAKHRAA